MSQACRLLGTGAAHADSCQEVSSAGPHLTAVACCLHLLRSGGCAALETSLARWQHNPATHRRALLAGVTAGALQVCAWQGVHARSCC